MRLHASHQDRARLGAFGLAVANAAFYDPWMWAQIRTAYRDSWRVALKYPLLFALPAAAEFAQHIVEQRIGMFANLEGMKAAADSGWRMGFGIVKILALFMLIYWVSRALATLGGAALRVAGDRR